MCTCITSYTVKINSKIHLYDFLYNLSSLTILLHLHRKDLLTQHIINLQTFYHDALHGMVAIINLTRFLTHPLVVNHNSKKEPPCSEE